MDTTTSERASKIKAIRGISLFSSNQPALADIKLTITKTLSTDDTAAENFNAFLQHFKLDVASRLRATGHQQNTDFYSAYQQVLSAFLTKEGRDANLGHIFDVLNEIKWFTALDTLLDVKWEEMKGIQGISMQKERSVKNSVANVVAPSEHHFDHQQRPSPHEGQVEPDAKDATDAKGFSMPWKSQKQQRQQQIVAVARDSFTYNMAHKERGKAVIFNQKNFSSNSLNARNGTDEDRNRLQATLETLGFTVTVHNDCLKKDVLETIHSLSKEDHSNRDCVVVAVFSHGEKEKIHAFDEHYEPNQLWDSFDANLCPTLAGKPKIFLIQACQGDRLDSGFTVMAAQDSVDAGPIPDQQQRQYTVPNKADFVMVYSTFPGYYSWRHTSSGSWFIQALCNVLQEHSKSKDFLSMLTIASRYVAFNYESNVPGTNMHGKKQIPLVTSTLTRDLFFFKTPEHK